jgi:hypothetical protein
MALPTVIDSWWEPTDAQLAIAVAHGIVGWSGYLKYNATDRIYHGWADATFERVLAHGLVAYGYCSGWAPAGWAAARARALGIKAMLDVESTVRPDGAWVDPWLTASPGVGIYAGGATLNAHRTHRHDGYQIGFYPGGADPGIDWPTANARPNGPCAWQYTDKVFIAGIGTVDGSHFGVGWNQAAVAANTRDIDMACIVNVSGGGGQWLLSGDLYVQLDPASAAGSVSVLPQITVDANEHANILAHARSANEGTPVAQPPPVLTGTVPVTGELKFG